MIPQILQFSSLCLLIRLSCANEPNTLLTTPQIIEQHGYPVENHTVQTSDGYILTMHRIPYSSKLNNRNSRRPVAFLMHGLITASSVWVLNGPGRALAYILSDAGYDVWMGNARGNVYSKKHVTLSPLSQKFWNFDWHEIGLYDTPAMIDYALNVTGEVVARYFGHSQGAASLLVLVSMQPSYQQRIRSVHFLAPFVFVENSQTPLLTVSAPLLGQSNLFPEIFGSTELLPSSRALELLAAAACRDEAVTQDLCSNAYFLIFGYDSPFLNKTMLPEILTIMPAGSSANQLIHYAQLYNSGKFRQFDYGVLRNILAYGSRHPPDYNLGNLVVPTFLYHSDNDLLADPIDVNRLIAALNGTKGALKGTYRVRYPEWNHLDFLFGIDVENEVYSKVMDDIAKS